MQIPRLEYHVAHACNLACPSCSHFSNNGHRGIVSPTEMDAELTPWSNRLEPGVFNILGGEPLLNPDIIEVLRVARKHFKHEIALVTNGLLLAQTPNLASVLNELKIILRVSIHHKDVDGLLQSIARFRQQGVLVRVDNSMEHWTQRYHGMGSQLRPFNDNQPRTAWLNCHARYCHQLFQGKLWKCSPLAYLPLEVTATDQELEAFAREDEIPACAQCPANPPPLRYDLASLAKMSRL
jgi:organic radical activating enzyme